MKTLLGLLLAMLLPGPALSQDIAAVETATDAMPTLGTPQSPYRGAEVALNDFKWIARPIVIFAETEADPAFQQQMALLAEQPEALAERDVVVITDTDPAAESDLRRRLRPRGFMLVIIGKDGEVQLRKPHPWDVREISRSIDKTPLRQQEVIDRRNAPPSTE